MRPFGGAAIGRMAAKSMSAATAKPGQAERAQRQPAMLDAQARRAAGSVVEVRVRAGEGGLLALGHERHAVDEMMAVALDVGQPQERHQRQVLLHAHPRQRGQVLRRHEIPLRACLRVELGDARGIEDRFVEALAVLAGDAAVAELQRRGERGELAVRLVDDERFQLGQRIDGLLQGRGALDRLLDEQRGGDQPFQRRRLAHAPPQLGDALDAVVLLVAVERCPVVAGVPVEHGRDLGKPRQVRRDVAADLQLVVPAAIVPHDLFQGLRQPIVDALRGRLIARHDRVEQADRVAHGDVAAGLQASQEPREVIAGQIRRQVCRLYARHVAADHVGKGQAHGPPERIEDGAIEERRAIGGHQRHQAEVGAARQLLFIGIGIKPERRAPSPRPVKLDGEPQGLAQLVEVLRIAEGRVLVEPLGAQRLGGDADRRAPVLERNTSADHGLRALGDGDDAEAERQAQRVVALEALDRVQLDLGGCGHGRGSRSPPS